MFSPPISSLSPRDPGRPASARALGLNIPILGGKGYAFITKPLNPNPKVPMMLVEKKVAVTPRDGTLRIAGTLELVNNDYSISPRRIDSIVKGARAFMNVPDDFQYTELWRGLRPCSPDGVPIIGAPKKYSNLWVSTATKCLAFNPAPDRDVSRPTSFSVGRQSSIRLRSAPTGFS